MVKTRNQARTMESDNISSPIDSAAGNETSDVATLNIESIPVQEITSNVDMATASATSPHEANTDTQNDLFTRLEQLFRQNSDQICQKISQLEAQNVLNREETDRKFTLIQEQTNKLEAQNVLNREEIDRKFTLLEEQTNKVGQRLATIEHGQVDLINNIVTKDQLEERFKQLVEAQSSLKQQISVEMSQQLETRVSRLEENLNAQFHEAEKSVVAEVMGKVNQTLTSVSSELHNIKQTVTTLPDTVDSLAQDINNLKIDQSNLKTTVTNLTTQVTNNVSESQQKVRELIMSEQVNMRQRLHAEVNNIIHTVTTKVTENQNDAVRSLQEEISSVRSILREDVPVWQRNVSPQLLDFHSERNNARDRRPASPVANVNNPARHSSRSRHSSSEQQFSTEVRTNRVINENQCLPALLPPTSEHNVASILLEDSQLKYQQFDIFSPDNKDVHPVIFIRTFRGALPESWSDKRKMRFIAGYLRGEAKLWSSEALEYCDTLTEFEQEFLSTYWSHGKQEKLRNEIYNPQPYNERNGNLRKYFEKYIKKSKFFDRPMSHREVLGILKNKLPTHIRKELYNLSDHNLEDFLSGVDALDLIYEDERARSNPHYGNSRKYNSGYGDQSNVSRPPYNNDNYASQSAGFRYPMAPATSRSPPRQAGTAAAGGGGGARYFQNNNIVCKKRENNRYHPVYQNGNRNNNRPNNFYNQAPPNSSRGQKRSYWTPGNNHTSINPNAACNTQQQQQPNPWQQNTAWQRQNRNVNNNMGSQQSSNNFPNSFSNNNPTWNTNTGWNQAQHPIHNIPVANISQQNPPNRPWGQPTQQGVTITEVTDGHLSNTTKTNMSN